MAEADDDNNTAPTLPYESATAEPAPAERARRPLVAGEIVAKRGFWFLLQRCVAIPLMLVGLGGYFLYDGFVGWPGSNQKIADLTRQAEQARAAGDLNAESALLNERKAIKFREPLDIQLQKLLGFALTPLGVVAAAWFLRRSRGSYRLTADDVLHVPGHPPVPASAIREMDTSRLDKKGIVTLTYDLLGTAAAGASQSAAAGATADGSGVGTITLDGFYYEQEPTDQIIDRLEAVVAPTAPAGDGEPSEEAATTS